MRFSWHRVALVAGVGLVLEALAAAARTPAPTPAGPPIGRPIVTSCAVQLAECEHNLDAVRAPVPAPPEPMGPPLGEPPLIDCYNAGRSRCCFERRVSRMYGFTWQPIGCHPNT